MRRLLLSSLFAFTILPTGAAFAESCERSEVTGAVSETPQTVVGKEVLSRTAYSCGHFWSSANIQEKSVLANGSALERFNLAAAYARTNRFDQAEALYRTVVLDGQYTNARMDTAFTETGGEPTGFNLSDEATRRLAALSRVRTMFRPTDVQQTAATSTPFSALDAGTNAADVTRAQVGATPSTAPSGAAAADAFGVNVADITGVQPISDQRALELDGLATPRN